MHSEMHNSHLLPSTLRICVEQAKDGRISGQAYSLQLATPLAFSDFGRLLLSLDAFMDLQNYPQSFQRKRLFRGCHGITIPSSMTEQRPLPAEQIHALHGKLSTFDLQVYARQNATWQGRILFLQDGAEELLPFHSVLDLVHFVTKRVPYRSREHDTWAV